MLTTERSYRRKHLRAPYPFEVLFSDDGFVHKARAINISEGGLLLDRVPHFPASDDISFMMALPQFPYLKNFSIEKLKNYTSDLLPVKVIRLRARMVRKIAEESDVDAIFSGIKVGLQFTEVDQYAQKDIAEYVNVFASNLIYLQVLIDSVNADKKNLEKIRILSRILGYESITKLSLLRKKLSEDYLSLQWL